MSHIPVLKNEIVEAFNYLTNIEDGVFVDGTLGNAGHSLAIADKVKNKKIKFIGIDKDQKALELSAAKIKKNNFYENFILINDDFKNIENILKELNINKIDGAMVDLGVSSMQLDQKERGFSFQDNTQPLDMRMDQKSKLTAKEILNSYPEEKLAKIIFEYGEEKHAKKIAREICQRRKKQKFSTVNDLLISLKKAIPEKDHHKKIHFATKTFQALRIETNQELTYLEEAIIDFTKILKPKSKFAIVSFHSLEDRIVKKTFKYLESDCICPPKAPICTCNKKKEVDILTKKPIVPDEEERRRNPRSRSAKLRIIERV